MKQITQKDLINLIEEKQENARIAYSQTFNMKEGDEAREQAQTNKAYIDAYQDLICYLNGVKIVPDRKEEFEQKVLIEPFLEELKKIDPYKLPITPYNEPKVEPLRNDRFVEFERKNYNDSTSKVTLDAKAVIAIDMTTEKDDKYEVIVVSYCGNMAAKTFIEEPRAKAYYNDLVEWWKYWKQN